jgi:hypothetical protein
MSRAGFFRELRHGSPDGLSLSESRREEAHPHEPLIVHYLESAPYLSVTGSFVDHYLNPADFVAHMRQRSWQPPALAQGVPGSGHATSPTTWVPAAGGNALFASHAVPDKLRGRARALL